MASPSDPTASGSTSSPPADPRPLPPEPPLPGDCCDSGCDPCVHDSYSEALAWYRQQLALWRARHPEAD